MDNLSKILNFAPEHQNLRISMCRISLETVRRANERTIRRLSTGGSLPRRRLGDDIVVSTSYNGKIFEQRIPMEKVNRAFAHAQRIADSKYAKGL